MNIEAYIQSGVLDDYCLGLLPEAEARLLEEYCRLYPALQAELHQRQQALETYSLTHAIQPPAHLKASTMDLFDNLAKEAVMGEGNYPRINKYADTEAWMQAITHLLPPADFSGLFVTAFYEDEQVVQMLMYSTEGLPEEEHNNIYESFIILRGACEVCMEGKVFPLKQGDFFEVPMNIPHSVVLKTDLCIAIVQHLKAA
jgi:quercetin dioxygenase-like cupin family protein